MEGGGNNGNGNGNGNGSGGGGGGGPAPFLLKTYDMVDDSSTDEIVSWSSNKNSFVVWNPPEFSRLLLPTYFKHNNFSSFIRQLNTYGFRKIDPERWEFANEEFVKDQKHLLKNIHRRKPIHSHTHPQGCLEDSERAPLDEEIERLSREKTSLQTNLCRIKQQKSRTKLQLEELEGKVQEMEQRQLRMMTFLARAVHNPTFVDHLVAMANSSMYFSAINKKRRLPNTDYIQEVAEINFVDDHSSATTSKSDCSHIFQQDFSNKLRLELSPAVLETNLLSPGAQSSNEDRLSPQNKTSDEDANMRIESTMLAPETLELSDTGASFALRKDSLLSRQLRENDLNSAEEGDGLISCHLNLTLASSSLQVNNGQYSARFPNHEILTSAELRSCATGKEGNHRDVGNSRIITDSDATMSSSQVAPISIQGHGAAQGQPRVNDVFWEKFLTERPGSSDTEEASSSFRVNPYDDQEERTGQGKSWRNIKDMEQLTL